MPNIGLPELIIIFVIILLLFGGKKLPEVGQNLGKAIKSFKDGISGGNQEAKKEEPGSAEASSDRPPVGELPREADVSPVAPPAQKEKVQEPAKKG